jgi:hypothetical protein
VDAFVSFIDDSLILFADIHLLSAFRGLLSLLAMLLGLLIYALMGLTPMIPKRLFLPLALFNPATMFLLLPVLIYAYSRTQAAAWLLSLAQIGLGVIALWRLKRQEKNPWRWPLVPASRLKSRGFSWANLCLFVAANIFLLVPTAVVYLALGSAVAVNHLSEGFLSVRPAGFTVQVRKYVRGDGKSVELVPMAHVAQAEFYRSLSESFPDDALILMEGVTDNQNLLTNKITYKRMARSLGLSEQQKEFKPVRTRIVPADVDVDQFTPNTIGFLNVVMLVHARGLNPETLMALIQYTPPAHFEEQLFGDLLHKRNRHLLEEIHSRLPESDHLIVPWGVAHMPEVAREIQRSGFHLQETREFVAIRFGSGRKRPAAP